MISLFTFKNELKKVFSSENIGKLKDYAEEKIIYFVDKDLLGEEKKRKVTEAVIAYILANFITKNGIVNFFIQLLIQFTPDIIQYLYDSLKKYVDGLTEKTA